MPRRTLQDGGIQIHFLVLEKEFPNIKNWISNIYKKEFLILENNDFCPQWLAILFVSFRFVSFRFVSFRFDLFRFVSICFVSFRFVSFRFVPFRFCFVSHFTGTLIKRQHHPKTVRRIGVEIRIPSSVSVKCSRTHVCFRKVFTNTRLLP